MSLYTSDIINLEKKEVSFDTGKVSEFQGFLEKEKNEKNIVYILNLENITNKQFLEKILAKFIETASCPYYNRNLFLIKGAEHLFESIENLDEETSKTQFRRLYNSPLHYEAALRVIKLGMKNSRHTIISLLYGGHCHFRETLFKIEDEMERLQELRMKLTNHKYDEKDILISRPFESRGYFKNLIQLMDASFSIKNKLLSKMKYISTNPLFQQQNTLSLKEKVNVILELTNGTFHRRIYLNSPQLLGDFNPKLDLYEVYKKNIYMKDTISDVVWYGHQYLNAINEFINGEFSVPLLTKDGVKEIYFYEASNFFYNIFEKSDIAVNVTFFESIEDMAKNFIRLREKEDFESNLDLEEVIEFLNKTNQQL